MTIISPAKVAFGSCYVYSPSGATSTCVRSRLLRALLKNGDAHFIVKYADRVREQAEHSTALAGFFYPTAVLVPVPGSTPHAAGDPSVAEHLAAALVAQGLGQSVWPGLRRVRAVRKSATAGPGSRPSVAAHFDSFAIDGAAAFDHVVLIDDVVTKGRTLLAAAARLRQTFPEAHIRAFALLRTMGLVTAIERLLEPCVGEIEWRSGDARRTP